MQRRMTRIAVLAGGVYGACGAVFRGLDVHANIVDNVLTRDEIMAGMTMDKALSIVKTMNVTGSPARLMAIVKQVKESTKDAATKDYTAEDTARDMLNGMMEEAQLKKELENVRCTEFETKQLAILRDLEQDIAYVNAEAASARSEILRATEVIDIVEDVKLPGVRKQITEHDARCKLERGAITQELAIVKADILVMKKILSMVCADQDRGQTLNFLQNRVHAGVGSIVSCVSCGSGQQIAWLRQSQWKPLLATLKSDIAKHFLQENLLLEFRDNEKQKPDSIHSVVLAQDEVRRESRAIPGITYDMPDNSHMFVPPSSGECNEELLGVNGSDYRGCQDKTESGKTCQVWDEQYPHTHFEYSESMPSSGLGMHNHCRNPMATRGSIWCYTTDPQVEWEYCTPSHALKPSTGVTVHECAESTQCKMAGPNCDKMKDRFLVILAGMIDKRNSLSSDLNTLNQMCESVMLIYRHSENALGGQLKEEQTKLAEAQSSMNENQQQSELSNSQHKDLDHEYHTEMTECCANKNEYTNEICALEKIRGELYRMVDLEPYITDCEVSDWNDEECSMSCGGGLQERERTIIMSPKNGTKCPPLRMERTCNMQGCPVDCLVSEWSQWSECTALCNGGVMTRSRSKTQEPDNDGEPCPQQSETKECSVGACNVDCVLGDWAEWGLCSKACDGGWETRVKPVKTPAIGQGECIDPEDPRRMEFQKCNEYDCAEIIPPGSNRSLVECTAMVDMVIMLDGSGSLGEYGWQTVHGLSLALISALHGNVSGVNLAFMLFSGPSNGPDLENCTSGNPDDQPDMEKQCGIKWVHHFSTDMVEVAEAVSEMEYPARTTLTSTALAVAHSELVNGRQDASSIVVVITDGKPMSPIKTAEAAAELKSQARLIFVPIGGGVGGAVEDMKTWASKPWEDNVLEIDTFAQLNTPKTINNILATICPKVE